MSEYEIELLADFVTDAIGDVVASEGREPPTQDDLIAVYRLLLTQAMEDAEIAARVEEPIPYGVYVPF